MNGREEERGSGGREGRRSWEEREREAEREAERERKSAGREEENKTELRWELETSNTPQVEFSDFGISLTIQMPQVVTVYDDFQTIDWIRDFHHDRMNRGL